MAPQRPARTLSTPRAAALLAVLALLAVGTAGDAGAQLPPQAGTKAAPAPPSDPKAAAAAAVEAAEAEQAAPVEVYPPERVPEESERTMRRLARLEPSDSATETVAQIREEYENAREVIEDRIRTADDALDEDAALVTMRDAQSQVAGLFAPIRERERRLDALSDEAAEALLEVETLATTWLATRDFARSQQAGQTVMRRIGLTREAIAETKKRLVAHRNAILALRDTLLDARSRAEASHEALGRALRHRTDRLLSGDDAPLWSPAFWSELAEDWTRQGLAPVRQSFVSAVEFARASLRQLALQTVLFGALAALLLHGRRRSEEALQRGEIAQVSPIFARPFSAGLLLVFLLSPLLYAFAPLLFDDLMVVAAVIPAVRIMQAFATGPLRRGLLPLGALFVLDRLAHVLAPVHPVWRLAYAFELSAALVLVAWIVRNTTAEQLATLGSTRGNRRLALGARLALALLALAWLAEVCGWTGLSGIVSAGVITASFAAVILFAGARVLRDLLFYLLRSRLARPSLLVQSHGEEIRASVGRVIDLGALLWWAGAVLDRIQLLDPVLELGRDLLDAGISVGRLAVDLGHVLAFGVTLWISFLLARLLAFVLDREVLPRLELARGVPYALTSLVRYTVLFVGFLFALAAAGFEIDRIAFLAGGLGVGIGFGLQNVVNNFISGLILLFERPVQVGDSVQLPTQGLFGVIRAIGIRASVIRTWDGAEVIVPNGDLISGVVTNWTLSDRRRRLDIPVDVARGSNPRRVVELLVGVAAANENVVEDPAPVCFFNGFGDSSLRFELRIWVRDFDVGLSTRSDVALAVEEALRREGIEVPYPRLDVQAREAREDRSPPPTQDGEPT